MTEVIAEPLYKDEVLRWCAGDAGLVRVSGGLLVVQSAAGVRLGGARATPKEAWRSAWESLSLARSRQRPGEGQLGLGFGGAA